MCVQTFHKLEKAKEIFTSILTWTPLSGFLIGRSWSSTLAFPPLWVPLATALSPPSVSPWGTTTPGALQLLTRLPAFALMPLSDQEEDEEAEQQDEGH